MQEPSIDIDKLSYEIFSILETKFLFGCDNQKLWIPKQIDPAAESKPETQPQAQPQPTMVDNGVSAIKYQRGKICILSIDGGGMRGILYVFIKTWLEAKKMRENENPLEDLKRMRLWGWFFFFVFLGSDRLNLGELFLG